MGVNSLLKTVSRQRRDCDLNPGPSAPESSTLTTRLQTHTTYWMIITDPDLSYSCIKLHATVENKCKSIYLLRQSQILLDLFKNTRIL